MNTDKNDERKTEHLSKTYANNGGFAQEDAVKRRAYDIWVSRNCTHGFDVEDWLVAEKELSEQATS